MSVSFEEFELDQERRQLLRSGEPVPLEPKAYELLTLLVERRPKALSRAQIRDAVWPRTFISESTLAVTVNAIRQALGDDAHQPRFIRTIHGFGYAFCGEAREAGDSRRGSGEATLEPGSTAPRPEGSAPTSPPTRDADGEAKPTRRAAAGATRRWVVAAAATLAVLAAGTYWLRTHAPTETPELTAVPLTSLPGVEIHPALSPDGRRVAFSWDGPDRSNFDVYVKDIASGETTRVTSDPAADYHAAWSPDGSRLAFLRREGTGARVILVRAGGGEERELASVFQLQGLDLQVLWDFWLDWSPDGRFLALSELGSDSRSWGIVLVSVETGEKRALPSTGNPRILDQFPAFSPNGRTLAFLRGSFMPDSDLLIQPLSSDMTPEGPARALAKGVPPFTLSWMPGGEGLLLADRIVPLDGSTPRPFSLPGRGVGRGGDPGDEEVSIRGTRLVYSTPDYRPEMQRVSLGGVPQEPAAAFLPSTRGEQHPAFAADGRRLAFCSSRSGDGHIWVCSVDASGCHELSLPHGSTYGCSPSWSPDGRRLAFDALVGDVFHVYVGAPEGGPIRPLTSAITDGARPRWSRDGRSIYFTSTRSGDSQIWKTPVDASNADAAAVRITRNGGIEAEESLDGHLYYAKRLAPGVWRLPLAAPGAVPEEKILDIGGEGRWCLGSRGIFVLHVQSGRAPAIRFFDIATRRTSQLRVLPPDWDFVDYGGAFAVSPDGQWAVVTRERITESDLMLVEGFR